MHRPFSPKKQAILRYTLSDYVVIEQGDFVVCAVTGDAIPLENLKYWNAERQEAYRDGVASGEAHKRAKEAS